MFAEWKKERVRLDYNVELDGHRYSVPYQLVQQPGEIRYTVSTAEVIHPGKRVAQHVRSQKPGTTLPAISRSSRPGQAAACEFRAAKGRSYSTTESNPTTVVKSRLKCRFSRCCTSRAEDSLRAIVQLYCDSPAAGALQMMNSSGQRHNETRKGRCPIAFSACPFQVGASISLEMAHEV